ncbi:Hypothetical protein Mbur_2169 [Methanococcoides burtonii DSM 6242]|uniref:Uncharacterized protein n=1 Tax=Methanococcoides burtonii (strain DSM 6242 / NBRC 107633 / OCM 468 / ACE-M) TaxID=259564 RepID=Q12U38_METBU|nr:Hypothetical protein Mbur_2169 [Methanococcoides burtonii DSM 6242]
MHIRLGSKRKKYKPLYRISKEICQNFWTYVFMQVHMHQKLPVAAVLVERNDTDFQRKKILAIGYKEWKKMGFSKGTLHHMKQNVKSDKPFTLNTVSVKVN